MRRPIAATLAGTLVAALLLDGCAGDRARQAGADPSTNAESVAPLPAPPPLKPLERLAPTARSDAASAVMPVIADGVVDPDEEGAEPGAEFERGGASWYGSRFQGRRTASGERFDLADFTAAHRTLPFGTLVCVRNLANQRIVMVRINDRGPASRRRAIDISQAAADEVGMVGAGVQNVALSRPVSGQFRCE
ncbi:septal ring lytic transglycosylase RlpA family protein [Xylophilus sp. GOD-11R]|uniref:septal ring lytic transglycosylase RlpA family protein n=1 Tax=Xylophilus sp. GOD-11R TaxID=3089814 RepID=UPI00298D0A2F|nr:septal ring lytic transglycosylase RlpA family protein [Xylophilus sp. GOD-11R]WPB56341.1 septal ring lytic transglycosylase RlpA family protein [Xylophilus sp. GOD-11R]